jgi:hypothetical protein
VPLTEVAGYPINRENGRALESATGTIPMTRMRQNAMENVTLAMQEHDADLYYSDALEPRYASSDSAWKNEPEFQSSQ